MNERLTTERPLAELLHPLVTPEMGLQTYDSLSGDKAERARQKAAFIAGEVVNPHLDYPRLNRATFQRGVAVLDGVLAAADRQTDPQIRATVWDSAAYRMAEYYWLMESDDLNRRWHSLPEERLDLLVDRVQTVNEQLYGTPEAGITAAITSEIWAQIDSKELTGRAAELREELLQGTTLTIADEAVTIAPLERVESPRLPTIPVELLAALKEKFYHDHPDIVALVNDYWQQTIATRPEGEQHATPDDMFAIFSAVHALRDPEGHSGVSVVMDPDATSLSWESSLMAVKVGGARPPITSVDVMLGKIAHEYINHAGRTIAGSQTSLPVLGTGMFSDADLGENSDYLTFEEGLASLNEEAVAGTPTMAWKPVHTEKALAISLAYEGRSFREVYETLWRARALMMAKSGEELAEKTIAVAQRNAYESTLRVFRGTPTDMPRRQADGRPRVLTYNKDLAYLKGKLQVVEFWKRYHDDPAMLDLAFKAKFDPMNHRQLETVMHVYGLAA